MNISEQKRTLALGIALAFVLAVITPILLAGQAHAATMDGGLVRFDRMKAATTTTGTVCFRPNTVGTEDNVKVTFPTGYVLGVAGTFTTNDTNIAWPSGGTALPGFGTATNVTGQVVTFPSGDLTPATLYCFNWINAAAVTQPAQANNLVGTITTANGGSAIDTVSYATASVTNDQIVVTASVDPTFSFLLSANTNAIGTVTSGVISTSPSPVTATVNTNAQNGWYAWAKDLNTGLTSASAGYTIPSKTPIGTNSILANNVAAYNTGITAAQGTGLGTTTVDTAFVGGTLGRGNGLNTTFQTLASSNGTADTAVLTINNNVAIAPSTPAATDYTDTITVVAAGLF